tara:strand:- start:543 stop:800 length:258 start_codon:yes stop_codon:yes gene_type:complete
MKRYRVWAYETIGHYIEIDAQNKSDAYNKAMDVNVLDWIQSGGDEIDHLNIKKKDIERIESNVIEFKPKETWVEGYKKWKEESND